jgi:hypothetical protein
MSRKGSNIETRSGGRTSRPICLRGHHAIPANPRFVIRTPGEPANTSGEGLS